MAEFSLLGCLKLCLTLPEWDSDFLLFVTYGCSRVSKRTGEQLVGQFSWIHIIIHSSIYHQHLSQFSVCGTEPGRCLNIKMQSYQYRDSHVKDKTVSRPSYLKHGNPHTWERPSLYWDGAQVFLTQERRGYLCVSSVIGWNLAKLKIGNKPCIEWIHYDKILSKPFWLSWTLFTEKPLVRGPFQYEDAIFPVIEILWSRWYGFITILSSSSFVARGHPEYDLNKNLLKCKAFTQKHAYEVITSVILFWGEMSSFRWSTLFWWDMVSRKLPSGLCCLMDYTFAAPGWRYLSCVNGLLPVVACDVSPLEQCLIPVEVLSDM